MAAKQQKGENEKSKNVKRSASSCKKSKVNNTQGTPRGRLGQKKMTAAGTGRITKDSRGSQGERDGTERPTVHQEKGLAKSEGSLAKDIETDSDSSYGHEGEIKHLTETSKRALKR